MADRELKIKLIKSPIGRIEKHKLCVKGLGFRKLHQTVMESIMGAWRFEGEESALHPTSPFVLERGVPQVDKVTGTVTSAGDFCILRRLLGVGLS